MGERVTRSRKSVNGAKDQATEKNAAATKGSHPQKRKASSAPNTPATKSRNAIKREQSPAPASNTPRPAKRARTSKVKPDLEEAVKVATKIQAEVPASPAKKTAKANSYNLTPGASPYPSYARPTPEECWHVHDLLAAVHGTVTAPKTIQAPSLQSSGCGEVPSVLDALIRTRLSAATNGANSSRAFRGLVDRFGIIKEGVGKGSVDWDKVRQAPVKDVFEAIKSGGLADVKSRDIQKILNMVREENQQQQQAEKTNGSNKENKTSSHESSGKKGSNAKSVLSLDHLHALDSETAFAHLLTYPGIGPKTASCVLLFCMQRPSFAVDTHVFRLVSWLGWVPADSAVRRMAKEAKESKTKPPPPATRNSTYAHLDVRIPDELKYPLHYLFIKHGKTCPFCSAKKDSKVREAWGEKKCPIAGLKGAKSSGGGRKKGGVKKEEEEEEEEDEEEDDDDEEEDEDEESDEEMHGVDVKKEKIKKHGGVKKEVD